MKLSQHSILMLMAKYRAIVRKTSWKNLGNEDSTLQRCRKGVCAAALLASLFAGQNLAAAETFTYDGSNVALQTINTNANSLAPDPANISANNNSITVDYSGSTVDNVYGGFSLNGAINHNTVNLRNGTVNFYILGGNSNTGVVSDNTVNISGGAVLGTVYGGSSDGDVTRNTINLSGGAIDNAVGGYSTVGSASYNAVNLSGGSVGHDIYGGNATGGGSANNNAITISGNAIAVGGAVIAGSSVSSDSNNNTITISGDNISISADVMSGGAGFGNTDGNVVTISGNNTALASAIFGGKGNLGSASHNTINISGTGTTVASYVEGGVTSQGATDYNAVNIRDGVFTNIVAGGSSVDGSANHNSVTIDGGTFSNGVFGGMSSTGTTSYNNIIISGGTINGVVMAGITGGIYSVHNIITISGTPDFSAASLYGGFSTGDYFTGNTLNVRSANLSVLSIQNFENYNFYLPASAVNGSTIFNVTGLSVDLTNTTVRIVSRAPGGARLHAGDTIILFDNAQNTPAAFGGANINDGLVTYSFVPVTSGGAYGAQVSGAQANPQSKALSEGHLVAVTNLNQGQDLLASSGMMSAMKTIANDSDTFAAMSAAHNRYATGSEITLNGRSLIAGVGKKHTDASSTLVNGFFLETGDANYSTDNSFTSGVSIRGDGDTNYFGAGYLVLKEGAEGNYVEGSVRAGQVKGTFRSGDFLAATGTSADYDASAPYYGLHIGIGKEKTISGNRTLDTYTKFLWTHQNGGSVVTAGGDPVNFAAVDSERWQLGAKLSHKVDEHTTVRTGLAYQYEFGANASASVYGYSIDTPSLKGSSGIVEFGVTKQYGNSSIDFSLQGFAGKSKGIIGNIEATFKF